MSLAAVCVDRGRIIRKEPTGSRVEGRTTFQPVPEQWFKCRLFLAQSNDTPDPQAGRWSSVQQPQALTVAKDLDGAVLEFHGDYAIEINSNEFGRYIWRSAGEPLPLRKKRRVIGWELFLVRVVEREYDDLLNTAIPRIYAPGV